MIKHLQKKSKFKAVFTYRHNLPGAGLVSYHQPESHPKKMTLDKVLNSFSHHCLWCEHKCGTVWCAGLGSCCDWGDRMALMRR